MTPPPQSGLPTSTLRTVAIRISAHVCRCFVEQALIIEPVFLFEFSSGVLILLDLDEQQIILRAAPHTPSAIEADEVGADHLKFLSGFLGAQSERDCTEQGGWARKHFLSPSIKILYF